MQDLTRRVERLEDDMSELKEIVRQNALGLQALQLAQTKTEEAITQLSQRVDSFVYHVQRLNANSGETIQRHEATLETMTASVTRLVNEGEADRAESKAFRAEMRSTNQRFDTLIDYLMNKDR